MPSNNCPSGPEAIDGRADDPTGISRPFAARIKTLHERAFAGRIVSKDSHRRTAPRLGTSQDGVAEERASHLPIHHLETSLQGFHDYWRQDQAEVGWDRPSLVTGPDLTSAGSTVEEVTGPLDWRMVGPATCQIGEPLGFLLEMDPGQGVTTAKIAWPHGHDQATVGERRVSTAMAHAVGAEVAGLTHRGHDDSAWTHTKRKQISTARLDVEVVLGSTERGVVRESTVAGDVDIFLRLLDPDAKLKRLGFERYAATEEHPISVPGAVADRQDGQIGVEVARTGHQTNKSTISDIKILDSTRELDFATQRLELAAEGPHDQRQSIRAEVRLGLVDDRGLAVAVSEDFEDSQDVGAGVPAGELTVAECAGPSFAEQIIALGIEQSATIEPSDVGNPVLDIAASFQNQRSISIEREHVSGEQPGRPGTDDHGSMFERLRSRSRPVKRFGDKWLNVGSCRLERGTIAGNLDLCRVDEMEVVLLPGIEALAQDPIGCDRVGANPHPIGQLLGEDLLRLVEFKADVGDFPGHKDFVCIRVGPTSVGLTGSSFVVFWPD
jgi:hypothetical protein